MSWGIAIAIGLVGNLALGAYTGANTTTDWYTDHVGSQKLLCVSIDKPIAFDPEDRCIMVPDDLRIGEEG